VLILTDDPARLGILRSAFAAAEPVRQRVRR
jgi:hypothetical protein